MFLKFQGYQSQTMPVLLSMSFARNFFAVGLCCLVMWYKAYGVHVNSSIIFRILQTLCITEDNKFIVTIHLQL